MIAGAGEKRPKYHTPAYAVRMQSWVKAVGPRDGVAAVAAQNPEKPAARREPSRRGPTASMRFAAGAPPSSGSAALTRHARQPATTTKTRVRAISSISSVSLALANDAPGNPEVTSLDGTSLGRRLMRLGLPDTAAGLAAVVGASSPDAVVDGSLPTFARYYTAGEDAAAALV